MILLIIACSLIGTVLLIGLRTPLSAADIPNAPSRNSPPSSVIVKPFRDDWHFNFNREGNVPRESIGKDSIKGDLRKRIASSSVPILRSRGMTDEEIKSELMRDFALTVEQIDEILAAQ